jgi:Leucine-rich repeat (LRR) protein
LLSLDLSFCDIDDAGAVSLSAGLKANTSLTALSLARNQIGAGNKSLLASLGVLGLAEALKTNRTLKQVDLSFNQFSPLDCQALGDALQGNKSLEVVQFFGNTVSDAAAAALADGIKNNMILISFSWLPVADIRGGRIDVLHLSGQRIDDVHTIILVCYRYFRGIYSSPTMLEHIFDIQNGAL